MWFKVLANFAKLCNFNSTAHQTIDKRLTTKQELSEYRHYITQEEYSSLDFKQFWQHFEKKFLRLANLAKIYNCIPATSVPCESSLSIAGYSNRKERSSLSTANLRYTMCLQNIDLIKKVVFEDKETSMDC